MTTQSDNALACIFVRYLLQDVAGVAVLDQSDGVGHGQCVPGSWSTLRVSGRETGDIERWLRDHATRHHGKKLTDVPADLHVFWSTDVLLATPTLRSLFHAGIQPWILIVDRSDDYAHLQAANAEWASAGYLALCMTEHHLMFMSRHGSARRARALSIIHAVMVTDGDCREAGGPLSSEAEIAPFVLAKQLASRVMDDLEAERGNSRLLRTRLAESDFQKQSAEVRAAALRLELELQGEQIAIVNAERDALLRSTSWRMTRPLRVLRRLAGPERGLMLARIAAIAESSSWTRLARPLLRLAQARFPDLSRDDAPRASTLPDDASWPLSDRAQEILARLDEIYSEIDDGEGRMGA